ncbi:O-antigen ligase family protein [Candidatus Peregrinibacteria bacterium]|nr:O-antigen ligase family protein [Candidatus Peregrinibacteria bacterium]
MCFFLVLAVFNPVFKKYDYGAEFPLVLILGLSLPFLVVNYLKSERAFLEKFFLSIFTGFVIISFITSSTKNIGLSEVLAFISAVTVYLAFAHTRVDFVQRFLRFLAIICTFSVIAGYFIYLTQPEVRMFGPFFNILKHNNVWPNAFALFLLMTWPSFLIVHKKWDIRVAAILGIILSGLLLTYSRGALIAFTGQVFLIFVYFIKRISFKNIGLIIFTAILAVGLFLGANQIRAMQYQTLDVEKKLTFQNGENLTSKQERIDFWEGAIELIKEKPLLGYGPFSFRYAYNSHQPLLLESSDHPHDLFLKIGAENGLIALFGFLGFLITLFFTVVKRFKKLSKENRVLVYLMGISVVGSISHNMIDYNFNFIANLLILFILMALIRSVCVIKRHAEKLSSPALSKNFDSPVRLVHCESKFFCRLVSDNFSACLRLISHYLLFIFSILIAILALYEGALWTLSYVSNGDYLKYSLYPRNFYLSSAEESIKTGDFSKAMENIDRQISLNKLDPQAFYLRGVVYCKKESKYYNLEFCKTNLGTAIKLNPLNDLAYYMGYLKTIDDNNITPQDKKILIKIFEILPKYFIMAQQNTHFTAYTGNVEIASEITDLLKNYMKKDDWNSIDQERTKMLKDAQNLRGNKQF